MSAAPDCLIFDIETVPDAELGRRLGYAGDDAAVGAQMLAAREAETGSSFLPLEQHRVVAISTLAALVGAWRSWRVRGLRVTAVLLMVLPATLVLVTGFGGEVLFRSFLFAAPFIAFLAAAACLPRDGRGYPWRNLVATVALTAVLVPGFMLADSLH